MNAVPPIIWRFAVAFWICVIFFSSTSLASKWCESAFAYVSHALWSGLRSDASSYDIVHLLADKGLHVTLFCVLAILLWQAIRRVRYKAWTILVAGIIVGSCSELLQRFFPDRDPAIRDVLINIAGTAVGIALSARFSSKRSQSMLVPRSQLGNGSSISRNIPSPIATMFRFSRFTTCANLCRPDNSAKTDYWSASNPLCPNRPTSLRTR